MAPPRPSRKAPQKGRAATKPAAAESGSTPALEWGSATLGALLLFATLGFLLWDALSGRDAPPDLKVSALAVRAVEGGHLVEFRVENGGDRPAAQVEVEGELSSGGEPDTAGATFDYVPAGSARTGGLFFREDPRQGALTLTAKGYADP
ncbi:TIGR02588 family protein [Phenylobacterium sp. LjRoot164]|uniref:TIGR02588 family protein n=1 Tax=unclassified Phenylobacterium TaxID=2640670 RepID=UPI003ECDEA4F